MMNDARASPEAREERDEVSCSVYPSTLSFLRDKERRLSWWKWIRAGLVGAVRRLQAAALVALQGGLRKHPRGQNVYGLAWGR